MVGPAGPHMLHSRMRLINKWGLGCAGRGSWHDGILGTTESVRTDSVCRSWQFRLSAEFTSVFEDDLAVYKQTQGNPSAAPSPIVCEASASVTSGLLCQSKTGHQDMSGRAGPHRHGRSAGRSLSRAERPSGVGFRLTAARQYCHMAGGLRRCVPLGPHNICPSHVTDNELIEGE